MAQHPPRLHIVCDENIPVESERVREWAVFDLIPAERIESPLLAHADALLVRSVTRVDAELLRGSPVKFVGTATTGIDHVDQAFLSEAGIGFADAAGSNALSVVDYLLAATSVVCRRMRRSLSSMTVGVVGCGRIGGEVIRRLEMAGARVLACDPPRARLEGGSFVSLETVLTTCDIVTLHTPLTRDGEDATYHLIGSSQLGLMRPGSWLINTSRGAVIDNEALLNALAAGADLHTVIDVWESEPVLPRDLLEYVDVATPHIAGYASDGKWRGGEMVLEALASHFGQTLAAPSAPTGGTPLLTPPDPFLPETDALTTMARSLYDIEDDDVQMRKAVGEFSDPAEAFVRLRREYPVRREFGAYQMLFKGSPRHERMVAALGIGASQRR
jgi:erythronate-4-phosphate dehydrogenase